VRRHGQNHSSDPLSTRQHRSNSLLDGILLTGRRLFIVLYNKRGKRNTIAFQARAGARAWAGFDLYLCDRFRKTRLYLSLPHLAKQDT
jgi:hypothetical protein